MSTQENELLLVDVEEGAARLGGNMALYKKLLQKFVDENYVSNIENALASGDIKAAADAAHTVKGVAANLSLRRLNALALDMEQQLKNGLAFEDTLSALHGTYEQTLAQIKIL